MDQNGNYSPIWEKVYSHIRMNLVSGELRPGRTISEVSLAEELGVSRTPIREALSRLAAEGIVERTSNGRLTVVTLTRQDIIDLYELREALELYAAEKATRQAVPQRETDRLQRYADWILPLREELKRSQKPELDEEQMRQLAVNDLGFHNMLIKMSRNARILRTVNETCLLIRIFSLRRRAHNEALLERIYNGHTAIARAVAERDSELARRVISEHIQGSLQERLDEYDHMEVETSVQRGFPYYFGISPFR